MPYKKTPKKTAKMNKTFGLFNKYGQLKDIYSNLSKNVNSQSNQNENQPFMKSGFSFAILSEIQPPIELPTKTI